MKTILKIFAPALCVLLVLASPAAAEKGSGKDSGLSKKAQEQYDLAFEKALVHYEKANLLYENEKLKEAAGEIEAIIDLEFPEGSEKMDGPQLQLDMYAFLAEIYLDLGRPKDAVILLVDGIKKSPDISKKTYQLYMTLGHALKTQGEVDAALEAFEKAQMINEELLKQEEKGKKEETSGESEEE